VTVNWGILSTARVNLKLLAGAREATGAEVGPSGAKIRIFFPVGNQNRLPRAEAGPQGIGLIAQPPPRVYPHHLA
jgi:hypothetical protein